MQISTLNRISRNSNAISLNQNQAPENGAPDLVVDKFETSPAFPRSGENVYLDVKVKNMGSAPATSFHVSVDGTSLPLAEQRVSILEPQGEKSMRFGPVRVRPGSYSFTARADNRQEVVESEEGNNWVYTWINVDDPTPPPPPRPPRNPWP